MTLQNKIKFFKDEVNYWITYFGLYNWSVYFDIEIETDSNASCSVNSVEDLNSNRVVTIAYEEGWIKEENDLNKISRVAFHEVWELLLMKLRLFAENKNVLVTEREVDDEVHNIIRIMENRVFDKLYKEKRNG